MPKGWLELLGFRLGVKTVTVLMLRRPLRSLKFWFCLSLLSFQFCLSPLFSQLCRRFRLCRSVLSLSCLPRLVGLDRIGLSQTLRLNPPRVGLGGAGGPGGVIFLKFFR